MTTLLVQLSSHTGRFCPCPDSLPSQPRLVADDGDGTRIAKRPEPQQGRVPNSLIKSSLQFHVLAMADLKDYAPTYKEPHFAATVLSVECVFPGSTTDLRTFQPGLVPRDAKDAIIYIKSHYSRQSGC
eukprot:scaffold65954_cov47-Prasinocladus_malaysianus.AAC.6